MPEIKQTVLFVCVHNAGKSQMAASLMRAKAHGSIEVYSGGTHPGDDLNGPAKTAIEELGASMDGEYPKAIPEELFMTAHRIIILGNEAELMPIEGMRGTIETWLTPEPSPEVGDKLSQTRIVRDYIASRIEVLFEELNR